MNDNSVMSSVFRKLKEIAARYKCAHCCRNPRRTRSSDPFGKQSFRWRRFDTRFDGALSHLERPGSSGRRPYCKQLLVGGGRRRLGARTFSPWVFAGKPRRSWCDKRRRLSSRRTDPSRPPPEVARESAAKSKLTYASQRLSNVPDPVKASMLRQEGCHHRSTFGSPAATKSVRWTFNRNCRQAPPCI